MSTFQSEPIIFNGVDVTSKINFTSIYIPNLPDDLMFKGYSVSDENGLKYFFDTEYQLGIIKRIDIATRPTQGGGHVKCAFVHFEQWASNTMSLRMRLAAGYDQKIYGIYGPDMVGDSFYRKNNAWHGFIVIKMNKSPIHEVPALEAEKMNIHQLVDNYKRLEAKLAEKDAKLAEKDAKLNELYEDLSKLKKNYASNLQIMAQMEEELLQGVIRKYNPAK